MTNKVTITSVEVNFHCGDKSLTGQQESGIQSCSHELMGKPDAIGGNWLSLGYSDLNEANAHAEGDASILTAILDEFE